MLYIGIPITLKYHYYNKLEFKHLQNLILKQIGIMIVQK